MNTDNPVVAWIVVIAVLLLIVVVWKRARRRGGSMTGAMGAVWDLQTDQKRKAIEIIVEKRAEARRPEYADGNLPELEHRDGTDDFSRLEFLGWQKVAGKYQDAWAGLTTLFVPALLDGAGIGDGTRVLDVACGPGFVSEAAQERGAVAVGVDFSPEMISIAHTRCPEIEFVRGDAHRLEFGDDTFDAAVMNFGLLHLANPEKAFAQAARVVRPGGRYAFTVWAGPDESAGARITQDAIQAHADMDVPVPKGPDHLRHGRVEDWRQTLGDAGFDPASVTVTLVHAEWDVPTDFFLFEAERHAGVRTAALLAGQSLNTLGAIARQMEQSVRTFAKDGGFAIPYAAYVVAATAR